MKKLPFTNKLFGFLPSIFFFLLFTFHFATAQNIGIGTKNPNASAQLDVSSSNKGFLPPRINASQRDAILNPSPGLFIFCSDCGDNGEMQYYDGSKWMSMGTDIATPPMISDNSGNTYTTVQIGKQVWMAENLRTVKYNDGTLIPLVTDQTQWANNTNNVTKSPMMCWYNNDQNTYSNNKFGALYNWYAINATTNNNKNVCPSGWHVPNDAEWTTLINHLDPVAGGGDNLNKAGGKMKSTGTQYWTSPNQAATNSSGFSALPAGYRFGYGAYASVNYYTFWWTASESGVANAFYRNLTYNDGNVARGNIAKEIGCSVRCVKD